jgi:hypothetical protein
MATQALAEGSERFIVEQSNFLQKMFVEVLRTVFSDKSIAEEYRYDKIREKRQLHIFRAFPKKITGLPCVIVETDISDVSIKQLGEEIIEQILDDDGRTVLARIYGGVCWVPVKITIMAKTTTDRGLITDLISSYIRFAARPLFARNRIEYLDIRSGEAGDEPLTEKTRMFLGTVEVQCQTEFKSLIDMSIYAKIQKISLDNITYSSADGDEDQPIGE